MAKLSIKTDFSIYHLFTAAHYARDAHKIEQQIKPPDPEKTRIEYVGLVTGSVIMSVAALESRINDIYLSAVDKNYNVFKGFELNILEALSEIWHDIGDKHISTLTKYQICLLISKKSTIDKSVKTYQDVSLVIGLRNSLIHYKSEWDNVDGKHNKLESKLKNKFKISPYSHINDAFFPKNV